MPALFYHTHFSSDPGTAPGGGMGAEQFDQRTNLVLRLLVLCFFVIVIQLTNKVTKIQLSNFFNNFDNSLALAICYGPFLDRKERFYETGSPILIKEARLSNSLCIPDGVSCLSQHVCIRSFGSKKIQNADEAKFPDARKMAHKNQNWKQNFFDTKFVIFRFNPSPPFVISLKMTKFD